MKTLHFVGRAFIALLLMTVTYLAYGVSMNLAVKETLVRMGRPEWLEKPLLGMMILACALVFLLAMRTAVLPWSSDARTFLGMHTRGRNLLLVTIVILFGFPWLFHEKESKTGTESNPVDPKQEQSRQWLLSLKDKPTTPPLGISSDQVTQALNIPSLSKVTTNRFLDSPDVVGSSPDGNVLVTLGGPSVDLAYLGMTLKLTGDIDRDRAVFRPVLNFVSSSVSDDARKWTIEQANALDQVPGKEKVSERLFGTKHLQLTASYTSDTSFPIVLRLWLSGRYEQTPFPK